MNLEERTGDEPDWVYWNACDLVLISEAVALSIGLDPHALKANKASTRNKPRLNEEYSKRLDLAERARLKNPTPFKTDVMPSPDGTIWTAAEPSSFREFLRRRGLNVHPSWQPAKASGAGWPWGAHETLLLQHLDAAARKFWINYDPADPSTAPTNEEVIRWLQAKRGCSKRSAEAIAVVLRADGLPKGPRRLISRAG